MNIKIRARLYAPGCSQRYGGINPSIFTREFMMEIPKEHLSLFCENGHFTHEGVFLETYTRKGSRLTCSGNLKSVSKYYFRKLESLGWKLDTENAKSEGFPNNKRNKALQKYIREQRRKIKHILNIQKSLGEVNLGLLREMKNS